MADAETILQPSLHSMREYADLVLDEAAARGIDVADLRAELDQPDADDWQHEVIDDALGRLEDAGYPVREADDTLLIWPRGADVPPEWDE